MNLIRILIVVLFALGLIACGNSDSGDGKPAVTEAAGTVEEASEETTPTAGGFVDSAQQAIDNAKKAAEEMEAAAEESAEIIDGALGKEDE